MKSIMDKIRCECCNRPLTLEEVKENDIANEELGIDGDYLCCACADRIINNLHDFHKQIQRSGQ